MRTTTTICIGMSMCAALLAGCAQPARVSDSLTLKDGDGVIVYRMSCGPQVAWGEFFRSGVSPTGFLEGFMRAGALLCQEGVQTQRLKAGRYFIGRIGYTGWVDIAEQAAMTFTVTPGKLNYIGHIRLPSSTNRDSGRTVVSIGDPAVSDQSAEAQNWLATKQARLQRYEFINALAHLPVKAGEQRASSSEVVNSKALPAGATVLEATVLLDVLVGVDGSVKDGRIAKSSGYPSLDESALKEAIRSWKLVPQTENGAPIEKWGKFQVTFKLVD